MRIETVMEVSDSFIRAYDYYRKLLAKKDRNTSSDLLLSQVARMFGFENIKKFKIFVMKREKEERESEQLNKSNRPY